MANSKGLIPADAINEIKSKNDIVNYISSKQELFPTLTAKEFRS